MATSIRLLQDYKIYGVPYKPGQLVSLSDDTLATNLITGNIADNTAAAITQALAEGNILKYPDVDTLIYQKNYSVQSQNQSATLAERPSASANNGKPFSWQVGSIFYISNGSDWVSTVGNNSSVFKAINDLPAKVLLESFDSEASFTYATNSTHSTATGQTQGTGRQQMNGIAVNATLTASKQVSAAIVPSDLGVLAFEVSKDATYAASVSGFALGLTRGGVNDSVNIITDSVSRFRAGKRFISVNVSEFPNIAALGSGTLTAIAKATQATPYTAQVTFDALYYNAAGRPTIVPTFDDVYDSIYTTVFPLFKSLGIVGTIAVPIDFVGNTGKMTLNQLNEMYEAGWDICCDSTRDDSVTDLTVSANALTSIQANQAYMQKQGWTRAINHFVWTNGLWNEATAAAFEGAGFLTGRTTEPQSFYDRLGLGAIAMTLPSMGFSSSATVATAVARITEIMLRGNTQFYHWHDISDSPSAIGWQKTKFFDFWINYVKPKINAGTLDVLTMSQHGKRTINSTI